MATVSEPAKAVQHVNTEKAKPKRTNSQRTSEITAQLLPSLLLTYHAEKREATFQFLLVTEFSKLEHILSILLDGEIALIRRQWRMHACLTCG